MFELFLKLKNNATIALSRQLTANEVLKHISYVGATHYGITVQEGLDGKCLKSGKCLRQVVGSACWGASISK